MADKKKRITLELILESNKFIRDAKATMDRFIDSSLKRLEQYEKKIQNIKLIDASKQKPEFQKIQKEIDQLQKVIKNVKPLMLSQAAQTKDKDQRLGLQLLAKEYGKFESTLSKNAQLVQKHVDEEINSISRGEAAQKKTLQNKIKNLIDHYNQVNTQEAQQKQSRSAMDAFMEAAYARGEAAQKKSEQVKIANALAANIIYTQAANQRIKIQSDADKKAEDEAKKHNDKMKQLTGGKGMADQITAGIMSAATRITGIAGVIDALIKLITFLGDAGKAAIDFAQAQYNLGVQVEASRRVLGAGADTLSDWKGRIESLRKQLQIYSNIDVTKAVTQTTVLTRVLGLNADQQEQVIKMAAALAQTTGVDLSQAIDDVTKALGGSSVVLDKYGLFIRDTDKGVAAFELGFTEKILKGTNALTSQELALATLATIMKQVNPLYDSLGNYQETLPGQLKAVDAEIENTTIRIGEGVTQLQLWGENMKLFFLGAIEELVGSEAFKEFNDFLTRLNKEIGKRRKRDELLGEPPKPEDFGLALKEGALPEGSDPRLISNQILVKSGARIERYWDGNVESLKKYLKALDEFRKKQEAIDVVVEQDTRIIHQQRERFGTLTKPKEEPEPEVPDEVKKAGQQVIDAWNDYNDNLKENAKKRDDDLKKASAEYIKDLKDLALKQKRAIEDLELEIARKRIDIETDYNRNLLDLTSGENEKRNKIEEEYQQNVIDETDKFYDALRDLENQYYFDLRDAVAENDAVAIKKLERRFNLDKDKLENSLDNNLNSAEQNRIQALDDLEKETIDRRAELERRHDQELEDLALYEERKREDLILDRQRETDDLVAALEEQRAIIEEEYQLQNDEIYNSYMDRLGDIAYAFGQEEDLTRDHLQQLFDIYDEWLGNDGSITQMIRDFYTGLANANGEMTNIPNYNPLPTNQNLTGLGSTSGANIPYNPLEINLNLNNDMLDAQIQTVVGDGFQDYITRVQRGVRNLIR